MNKVEVFNLALSAMGTRNRVSSPTESSTEARECLLWYDVVRKQILCSAPFQEATANQRLAVAAERVGGEWLPNHPDPGWRFSYSSPADMLRPRRLATYESFILSTSAANERRIETNVENAILVYTKDQENIDMWSPALVNAIAYGLASAVCMKLGGKMDRLQLVAQQANSLLMAARVVEGNTDEYQLDSLPPWLSARGVPSAASNRYFYPYGPMFVSGGVASG
jgi:hypothetical protein